MSLSLGSIFTTLNAETSGFLKGFAGATRTAEKFANDMKRASSQIASVGTALTAMAGGALALAATVDGPTKRALDGMKQASTGLAVEVSRTLAPAVKAITADIRAMADWFAGLSPSTKAMISNFAVFAAQAALVGTALSKISGLVAGVAGAFGSLAKAIAGVGVVPILGVALAVAAVLAAVVVLHKAWRENWGGIKDQVRAFLQWFQDGFSGVFGKIGDWLNEVTIRFLDFVDNITSSMQAFFEAVGMDSMAGLAKSAKEMIRTLREDVQKQGLGGVVKSIIEDMADTGKEAGSAFKKEFKLILKELGISDLFKGGKPGTAHSGKAPGPRERTDVLTLQYDIIDKSLSRKGSGGSGRIRQTSEAVNAEGAMEASKEWWGGLSEATEPALAQFAGQVKVFFEDQAKLLGTAIMNGVSKLSSMLGDVGDLMQAGIQGFQSGGLWGGIIALVLELLSKFERWGEVLDKAQGAFDKLMADIGPGLGEIVDAFKSLIEAVQPLANLIHGILNPILSIIGTLLTALGETLEVLIAILDPVLTLIGDALGGIADLLKTVAEPLSAVSEVLKPILKLFGDLGKILVPLAPLFKIIGFVLKVVSLVILGVIWAIGKAINAIAQIFDPNAMVVDTDAIEDQMESTVKSFADTFEMGGKKITGAINTASKSIEDAANVGRVQTTEGKKGKSGFAAEGTGSSVVVRDGTQTGGASPEEVARGQMEFEMNMQDLGDSAGDAAENLEKFNEALTNIPSGYKVALARFNATNPIGGVVTELGGKGQTIINIAAVNVQSNDPDKFIEVLERRAYQAKGTRFAGLPGVP